MKKNEYINNFRNADLIEFEKTICTKEKYLLIKRFLDIFFSVILIAILMVPMIVIALIIYIEDRKSPFFLQKRVAKNGKIFRIIKFRSMKITLKGDSVTVNNDNRITKVGKFIRDYRLDELPQLFNILKGDMSFVGARPEIPKYVEYYTDDMLATLLLPVGLTSRASIMFKDEATLLSQTDNIDETYVSQILPQKMKYNIEYINKVSFLEDTKIAILTVKEVFF
ncbi:sugar transferase [Enterococcus gallinarum]|uniref:sugar transferase n=1 Tax=Enterococcus gallinarum TaxID=1353 RepID=UPI000F4F1379|nr:sugar transferase [Enterococcus gallinarum]ROY85509.1 sugar transferase [Enterococcus gallinarum]